VARDDYTMAEIAERDGYVCWLCDLPVDMALVSPHDGSPSTDHVIQIADGGTDTRGNVRLAHRLCNSVRAGRDRAPSWVLARVLARATL